MLSVISAPRPRQGVRSWLPGIGLVLVAVACASPVQKTAVEVGGGMRKGSPPMCYQYRGESRPLSQGYDIWAHLNNTCGYAVDCTIADDVSGQENRVVMQPYQSQSIVLVRASESKRVNLSLDCLWKP